MLELVPEKIDGAIVCNVVENPNKPKLGTDHSVDMALALHNWIKEYEIPYMILDLQDEKDVCEVFLAEVMQLRKRLPIPFLFAGVMDRPLNFLMNYHHEREFPTFATPEDAVRALRMKFPELTESQLSGVTYGKTISEPRIREVSEAEALEED